MRRILVRLRLLHPSMNNGKLFGDLAVGGHVVRGAVLAGALAMVVSAGYSAQ
jgi:hypothetical protein